MTAIGQSTNRSMMTPNRTPVMKMTNGAASLDHVAITSSITTPTTMRSHQSHARTG